MGKQINYWLGYADFLQVTQAALNCGCVIIKRVSGQWVYGQASDIVTQDEHQYYFYLPEAGELMEQQIPFLNEQTIGYNAAGNTVIEAGFSFVCKDQKKIVRSRLFVTSGYYDKSGKYIARPECLTKTYQKLVRVVKKVAPYTELTDCIVSIHDSDYLQEKEWTHKEYVSPSYLALKTSQNYELVSSL